MEQWDTAIKSITAVTNRMNYLYAKWAKQQSSNRYIGMILYMLQVAGVQTQKEIADIYGMPKQTVHSIITELHKQGYIRLIPDEKDKRSKKIQLTEEGIRYADSIVRPLLHCEMRVLAKMGAERVAMLIDTMTEYADLLEEELQQSIKEEDF